MIFELPPECLHSSKNKELLALLVNSEACVAGEGLYITKSEEISDKEEPFCLNLQQALALVIHNSQLELHWVLLCGLGFILGGVIHFQGGKYFFQSFFLWSKCPYLARESL